MASLMIRKLDPRVKERLRARAAEHCHSIEAETQQILAAALTTPEPAGQSLYDRIRARFAPLGGVDLDPPPREPVRKSFHFAGPSREGALQTSRKGALQTSRKGALQTSREGALQTSREGALQTSREGALQTSRVRAEVAQGSARRLRAWSHKVDPPGRQTCSIKQRARA